MDKIEQYNLNNQLITASTKGDLDLIKQLIEQGADIHSSPDILLSPSANGHLDIVTYLVEKNINIHSHNNHSIKIATKFGHLDIVKYLMGKGLNIQSENNLLLLYASKNGHLEIVKYLIENGADGHIAALEQASYYGKIDVIKFLLTQNDYNENKSLLNKTLFNAAYEGHLEIVKYLIEQGVDIHVENNKTLINAVINGYLELTQYLILEQNCNSDLALEKAKAHGCNNIIEWCENYIKIKELNDKLGHTLAKKEINTTKNKI